MLLNSDPVGPPRRSTYGVDLRGSLVNPMTDVAFIFPGQGAQFVGMGKEFYETSPQARAVFDQADAVMANGLNDVIFNGPSEKLTSTAYCQPAIFTMSLASLKALETHPVYQQMNPRFAAGLSLGEYSALAAAGNLSLTETLRLVQKRSEYMEEATRKNPGKMAAIIGLDKEKIAAICGQTGAEVANFNSPQQIVITGHAAKVETAAQQCKEAGAKNVIMLDVSGAFHSSLMKVAAEKFAGQLISVDIKEAKMAVVSNVNGRPAKDVEAIRQNLAKQITSPVQWVESMQYIASQGVTHFFEIGPGNVLKGLIRRIDPNLKVHTIAKPSDIEGIAF